MFLKRKKYRPNPFANKDPKDIRLTFCVTHKNRTKYLQQTLAQNLSDNRSNPNVDFVLVDFDDDMSTVDWLKSEFKEELKNGGLKVYHSDDLDEWHSPKAKNCAHALAEGDILVNLDCDNYTGPDGGSFLVKRFLEAPHEIVLWQYSRRKLDGSFGRIAIAKDTFYHLGGYNESFLPMGFQDGDLIKRAKALGLKIERDRNPLYNAAIKHDKFRPKDMTWKRMNEHNQRLSRLEIKAGKLVANEGAFGKLANGVTRIV